MIRYYLRWFFKEPEHNEEELKSMVFSDDNKLTAMKKKLI